MWRLILISTTLFWGTNFSFISEVSGEPKPLLPPVNVEFIIIGLAHADDQLQSGMGYFKHYGSDYFKWKKDGLDPNQRVEKLADGTTRVTRSTRAYWFAFNGKHRYTRIGNWEEMYDGKMVLSIRRKSESAPEAVSMRYGDASDLSTLQHWGLWFKNQPLSDYLQKQETVRLSKTEKIDGIACYVIEVEEPQGGGTSVKFWVAPLGGFRPIQRLEETRTTRLLVKIKWKQYQIGGTKTIWFPERGVSIYSTGKDESPSRNEIEVTDFQPNIDVSHLFDPQLATDTKVFDQRLRRFVAFEEVGWKKLQPQP